MDDLIETEIKHSTLIKAPIEKVYDAITTAEELDKWFTNGAHIDRRSGGEINFRWTNERGLITGGIVEDGGPIIEVNRPNKFIFQWHPDNNTYITTVELTFEQTEKGTIVKVKENGFQNTHEGREAFMGCATGWGEALTLLKFFIEHGITY